MIELNKIYNEDCLVGMKRIPDKNIDLIVTDPLLRGYPDSELSWNFFRAFDECKDIAEKKINDLAEKYGKED